MLCINNSPRASRGAPNVCRNSGSEMQAVVQRALAGKQTKNSPGERRRQHRTPYPYLIKIVPVAADGETRLADELVVVGKHLSLGGLDFYHRDPLPYRWALAWLDGGSRPAQPVLVELLWCRFNKQGWYENGGRFVRLASGE